MAMNNISTAARNAACDGVVDQIDTGAGTSHIRIYTAAFATLLAELDFAATAFGAAAAGVATAAAIVGEASAPAAGTAAVCRIVDKDGTTVYEGTVTATGGGGDIELSNVVIAIADTVDITSMTVTMPAS